MTATPQAMPMRATLYWQPGRSCALLVTAALVLLATTGAHAATSAEQLAGTTIRMCTAYELGFNTPDSEDWVAGETTWARGDTGLSGFDVDLRELIWPDTIDYTVTIESSYNQCLWLTRNGTYDVAWAPYSVTATRESCIQDECVDPVRGESATLTASCCIDYGRVLMTSGVSLMIRSDYLPPPPSTIAALGVALVSPTLVQ